jgi:hypothetical protein
MFPKDPPIKNKNLLGRLSALVHVCEWPDGCSVRVGLENAHIRARGMGGGRRKDTEDNLVRLCLRHHHQYDSEMGQSPERQRWMRLALLKRPIRIRDAIRGREEAA